MVNTLSIGTIAISLYLLGAFLLVNQNVSSLVGRLKDHVSVTVYLSDSLSEADRQQLIQELRDEKRIDQVVYISEEQARARFREYFQGLADLPDYMEENPFPASIEIQLRQNERTGEAVQALVDDLNERKGVEEIDDDLRWVERLASLMSVFRVGGWLLGGIFLGACAFTIANVMKLAIYSRQEEIHIMQLIGAPLSYIKGPFILEGMLQGIIGASLALTLLLASFVLFQGYLRTSANVLLNFLAVDFLTQPQLLLILGAGLTIGFGAGFLSVYRFLLNEG